MVRVIHLKQTQKPVGQGGFHVGELWDYETEGDEPPDQVFSWVYDCGSNQTDALEREINGIQFEGLDILFLSHLDNDHVSGVDHLLIKAPAKEVVLPYLNEFDWVLHLAQAISNGTVSGTFINLVSDPKQWFQERGVERIYYVPTRSDDDDGDAPVFGPIEPPDFSKTLDDRVVDAMWTGETTVIDTSQEKPDIGLKSLAVHMLDIRATRKVALWGAKFDWILAPFACRPSDAKMRVFKNALTDLFGSELTQTEYASRAKTAAGRKKLRQAYDAVFKNHNLHSMALYSGPKLALPRKSGAVAELGRLSRGMRFPAWLSTGDFEAQVKVRRNKLISYFAPYAPIVGTLSLPHHGSDHSFDVALVDAFPALEFTVVPVGPNSYGHPGPMVQAEIAARPSLQFIRTDQNPSTKFEVSAWCEAG